MQKIKTVFAINVRKTYAEEVALFDKNLARLSEERLEEILHSLPIWQRFIPFWDNEEDGLAGCLAFFPFKGLKETRKNISLVPEYLKEAKKFLKCEEISFGLGELTAPAWDQGTMVRKVLDESGVSGVYITNGNSLTAAQTAHQALYLIGRAGLSIGDSLNIGVLGGNGSVAFAASEILAPCAGTLTLIDLPNKLSELENKTSGWKNLEHCPRIVVTDNIGKVVDCDVLIVATSADKALVTKEMIPRCKVLCDVTVPSNVDVDEALMTGLMEYGDRFKFGMDLDIPIGFIYSCFAETILKAMQGIRKDHIGYTNAALAREMLHVASESDIFRFPSAFFGHDKRPRVF